MKSKLKPLIIFIGLMLLLTGCNQIVLNPKGIIGQRENELIIDAILLMLIVVVPVIFMTFIFAWKYRATNKKANYAPKWHHSNAIEVFVWGVPIIIILVLGTLTWRTTHELDPYKPLNVPGVEPITIQVVALDWKWLFIYPKQNIASVNLMQFPVNVPVHFILTSGDTPMNAFHIPQLGTQIYAMAGMKTHLHLIANEAGDYFGRAVNINGSGFSAMQFVARASSMTDFNNWVDKVKKSSPELSVDKFKQLSKPSENNPVTTYKAVSNNLFDNLVMSFMMPGMDLSKGHQD
ncbi:MAG: cyoA [Burkholderiales bacterium]|nr:cyoA [Burkholderiales bacterium]MCE3268885.1 cyoA [Burkholderiales bacterium]